MKKFLRNYFTPYDQKLLFIIVIISFASIIAVNISSDILYSNEIDSDSLETDIAEVYQIRVDIRTASKAELMQINGIGDKSADKIIAFRDTFTINSNRDLLLIPGIGEKSLAKWMEYLKPIVADTISVKAVSNSSVKLNAGKIDINTASKDDFMKIKGIGEKKAVQIQTFINQKGRLKNLSELLEIKGIGKKTLAKIEELFYIGS